MRVERLILEGILNLGVVAMRVAEKSVFGNEAIGSFGE
jgi:hypothetical protein